MYLFAIVIANLDIVWFQEIFGYTNEVRTVVTVLNALVFIAFDLSSRDRLHEAWHEDKLVLKMSLLIATGSLISWMLNSGAAMIALASMISFGVSAVVDTVVYGLLLKMGVKKLWRMNGSNLFSSATDSFLFPTIAFGGFSWMITIGNFLAKVIGGVVWAYILVGKRE